jgi:hypothetical protein
VIERELKITFLFYEMEDDWERRLRGWCRVGGGEADLRFMAAGGGWLGFGLAFPLCGRKEVMCFQRRSLFCFEEVICFGCNIYHVSRWRYPLEVGDLMIVAHYSCQHAIVKSRMDMVWPSK